MSDIAVLLARNTLDLPQEDLQRLNRQLKSGMTAPLSPEREAGLFMLYSCGDSLDLIAIKTNIPLDVVYVTALKYSWKEKAGVLHGDVKEIQKSLATSILVATYLQATKDLADVIAGRKTAEKCSLIPKSITGLKDLMSMVSDLTEGKPLGKDIPGNTVVHAQNVQINNGLPEKAKEPTLEDKAKYELLGKKK